MGNLVCDRLGAAADLLITDEDMRDVARWVVRNTPFDRLYFYGDDLPIHVSFHPEPQGQVVIMRASATGRLVPRVVPQDALWIAEQSCTRHAPGINPAGKTGVKARPTASASRRARSSWRAAEMPSSGLGLDVR